MLGVVVVGDQEEGGREDSNNCVKRVVERMAFNINEG